MSSESEVADDIVHVTSKGQATIPIHLRARFGITAPGRVRFTEEGGRLVVRPVRTVDDMMGSLRRKGRRGPSLVSTLRRERRRDLEAERT